MEILGQRDNRWKDVKLGTSNLTIGNYGCTITCISMLAGLTPIEVNDRLKAVGGFSQGCLVIWTKINEAIPWLNFGWRGYGYDNDKVSSAIIKNGACLVEVDFDGNNGRTDDKHWVLFKGNKRMNDPWSGTEAATSKYSPLTGYAVIDVDESKKPKEEIINLEETMTDEQKRILDFLGDKTEGDVREAIGYLADKEKNDKQIEEKNKQINSLLETNKTLVKKQAENEAKLADNLEIIANWQLNEQTANENIQTLQVNLEDMTAEKNKYKGYYENKCAELKEALATNSGGDEVVKTNFIDWIKSLFIKK